MTRSGPSYWAVVEIMGHRERAGLISEVEMFGGKVMMIERPMSGGYIEREFYGLGAVFSWTIVSREVAIGHYTNRDTNRMDEYEPTAVAVGFEDKGGMF
ncbi:MAG: hypothetical protein KDI55_00315 [Anaerolineae bacterium]|nr:hypothetical protein [Anaerolineae bacterium]